VVNRKGFVMGVESECNDYQQYDASDPPSIRFHKRRIAFLFLVLVVLYFTSRYNYLLFRKLKKSERQKENLIVELKQALSEVKELKRIIPICSHCRKIRADEGFWNIVEAYIGKHTDAEFSHGICPECYKKEIDKFVNKRAL